MHTKIYNAISKNGSIPCWVHFNAYQNIIYIAIIGSSTFCMLRVMKYIIKKICDSFPDDPNHNRGWNGISDYEFEKIEQKGMTFDHVFGYSIPLFSSLLKKEGRRKGELIAKIVIKSHAFLLDRLKYDAFLSL